MLELTLSQTKSFVCDLRRGNESRRLNIPHRCTYGVLLADTPGPSHGFTNDFYIIMSISIGWEFRILQSLDLTGFVVKK
jgi:hypothetical protein